MKFSQNNIYCAFGLVTMYKIGGNVTCLELFQCVV